MIEKPADPGPRAHATLPEPARRGEAASADPLLRLENISVSFHGHEVVRDVCLEVASGEVMALIGPSGAGKSSLLRCVNFLEVPSGGTVYLGGHPVGTTRRGDRVAPASAKELAAHRRDVGMVFQQFNLFPHLTAQENVALAQVHSLGRSKPEATARARQELERIGLAEKADERPAKCSGGQQQRIAIARALAMDPKIMLFDEPTSSLDPELGAEVLAAMRRLADEGMTMLVVTHEMHFAEDVADRIVFMADGRIVEQGPAAELIREPRHDRTIRFLAAVRDR
jgi:polar amino acid transport system ATP-binding protein